MFRVRCNAAGANYVLDRQGELDQVSRILRTMVSKLGEDGKISPHAGKNISAGMKRDMVPGATPNSSLDEFFSAMDKIPFGMMFADRGLVLRHVNPAALAIFKPLEPFLPIKTAHLLGQPIGMFHRRPAVAKKIISNPENLPYQTQIIFGPKTLDLRVSSARDGDGNYLGVIARWMEIEMNGA
jgi:hypothetical protein